MFIVNTNNFIFVPIYQYFMFSFAFCSGKIPGHSAGAIRELPENFIFKQICMLGQWNGRKVVLSSTSRSNDTSQTPSNPSSIIKAKALSTGNVIGLQRSVAIFKKIDRSCPFYFSFFTLNARFASFGSQYLLFDILSILIDWDVVISWNADFTGRRKHYLLIFFI